MASRALILFAILVPVITLGQEEPRSSWLSLTEAEKQSVESHATGYKDFMRVAKTELSFVREAVTLGARGRLSASSPMTRASSPVRVSTT